MTAPVSPSQDDADKIIDYALTICMYGERAPGGNENWPEFAHRAEDYLRRRGCARQGSHTPDDPRCPDCRNSLVGAATAPPASPGNADRQEGP